MTLKKLTVDEIVARTGKSRDEVVEVCGERAAIREYLCGLSRAMAEKLALEDALDLLGGSR
jgi:hypothetical protein